MNQPTYKYLITVMDNNTGEPQQLETIDVSLISVLLSRLQGTDYIFVRCDNMGIVTPLFDFLKDLNKDNDLNFGQEGNK